MMMKTPHLIQRCKFTDIKIDKMNTGTVAETLSRDYMGHIEYEFNTVQESYSRIMKKLGDIRVIKTEFNDVTGRHLYFIGTEEDFNEYKQYIPKIISGDIELKEKTDLSQLHKPDEWHLKQSERYGFKVLYNLYNVGWDLENDVILAYTPTKYAKAILEAFKNDRYI